MLTRLYRVTVMWLFITTASGCQAVAQHTSSRPGDPPRRSVVLDDCLAVDDSVRTDDASRIAPGLYRLTMIAEGSWAPGSARGNLWLSRTSAEDRSAAHPSARAPDGDTASAPLFGWTDIDVRRVGVLNYAPDTGQFFVPDPTSRDPLYPGVIVLIQNWQPNHGLRQNALLIGTFANRRPDGFDFMDGGGVALWVRRFSSGGFAGHWSPFGRRRESDGHFCAVPYRN